MITESINEERKILNKFYLEQQKKYLLEYFMLKDANIIIFHFFYVHIFISHKIKT